MKKNLKKKILFTAFSLELGGIETALVSLLKRLDYNIYDITLILEKKDGIFLDELPHNITVLEYKVSSSHFVIFRKIYNGLKLIKWWIKLHNKYDFSCSFCTYSIPCSYLARMASSNNALWMHGNYYVLYGTKMALFLDNIKAKKFKKIVFVSEENRRDVCKHYNGLYKKSIVCNNFIDGDLIIKKSKQNIDFNKSEKFLFINVGRHDEHQKRLSRIIDACKKLDVEGYKFEVLFIGDGPDTDNYKKKCRELGLDNIVFLGRKKNPFPYYLISDAVLLSSDYEGYPVVFLESMVLNKPILSTKISDWEELDGNFGIFCELNTNGVYNNMKFFMNSGFKNKTKFDYKKYNDNILNKINNIINN